jgi:flavin-dependent thymidylate synthase
MDIILAGFNVDLETLKELSRGKKKKPILTPETISAAYARISRSPESPTELRKVARKEIEKARKSNRNIIFEMGHHSIAEHSVFNFDIIGISRLAVESLEGFRLNSYTEKSQRYVALDENFVIPEEIKQSPLLNDFINIINLQNHYYHQLLPKLKDYFLKRVPEPPLADAALPQAGAEGYAKEDARYITSLAVASQLGATINARNLELMIRRFASHRLTEIRELGMKLFTLTGNIAPSIVLFHQANEYDQKTYPEIRSKVEKIIGDENGIIQGDDVQLAYYTPDADNILIAALLHRTSNLPFNKCLKKAQKLMLYQKKEVMKAAGQYLKLYDTVLREFEHINLTYDLIVSASCFAQLKRHRLATITAQPYDPALGITIPKSISEIGEQDKFTEVIHKTEDVYEKLYKKTPLAAQYVLTNAHQKRVLFSLNVRELYHVSRLREDKTAQWDIRNKAKKMVEAAKHFMPLSLMFIGAKDKFSAIYQDIFGQPLV